jgi:uncharacterized protein
MRRLWTLLFVVTAVCHVPFAMGAWYALGRAGAAHAAWLSLAISLALVISLRGRIERVRADRPTPRWRIHLVEETYYAHWCAVVGSSPLALVACVGALAHGWVTRSGDLAAHVAVALLGTYLFSLAISTYGVMVRRRWVRVRELEVPVTGLGASFDGYRIAHLSDLHIGGLTPREVAEGWADRVRRLDVDLVALTGDYVTHGDAFHDDIAAVLSSFSARDGVVAVLGNHDYFGDADALVEKLGAGGVTVLRNERTSISRGDHAITIAGVDDTWSRRADVAKTLGGGRGGDPVIALAHDPQLFPALARGGARVVLGGHTHWGQIAVPFLATKYNLSRLSYRYHAGTVTEGGAVLYVSPGLGTTGPPVRIGAPPEITVLRLRAR